MLINKFFFIKLKNLIHVDRISIELKTKRIEKRKIFKVLNIINILNQKQIKVRWAKNTKINLIFVKLLNTTTYLHNYFFFIHNTLSFNNYPFTVQKKKAKKNIKIILSFSNLELGVLLSIKELINLKIILPKNNLLVKSTNILYLINIL